MIPKRVISVDVDGVIANFSHGFTKLINKVYPEKNLPDNFEPSDWNYTDVLTKEEFKTVWPEVEKTKNFWRNLPAFNENTRALGLFLHETYFDFNVYYITSRVDTKGGSALEQTKDFLRVRDLLLNNTSVSVVKHAKHKAAMLEGIGAVAHVDDHLPTVVQIADTGIDSFLLDRPWNRADRPERDNIKIVSDLAGFLNAQLRALEQVKELAQKAA